MKAFFFTILFVLGGARAAASVVATDFTADAAASCIKQLGVSCLSAEGAGVGQSASTGAEASCSLSSKCGGYDILLTKNLTGEGAAAPDQSNFSSAAAATAVSTAGDSISTGRGVGCSPLSECGNDGILTNKNLIDTAIAAAAASCGPPKGSLIDGGDLCYDLLQGSGTEKKTSTLIFAQAHGHDAFHSFASSSIMSRSARVHSMLRRGGGSCLLPRARASQLLLPGVAVQGCEADESAFSCAAAATPSLGAASRSSATRSCRARTPAAAARA